MTDTLSIGKLPPQAVDFEETTLGAIMLEKDAIMQVVDFLKPRMFYRGEHQDVYRAILSLHHKGHPIDILTVTEVLKKNEELDKVGGPYFVSSLTNRVASAANLEYHARIIHQQWIKRQSITLSAETIRSAYDDGTDAFELLENMEKGLAHIYGSIETRQERDMTFIINELSKKDTEYQNKQSCVTGVETGLKSLDNKIGGLYPSELIVIGARPGMGKTAAGLTIAVNNAKKGVPSVFFSLEMGNLSIAQRVVSMLSGVNMERIRRRILTDEEKTRYEEGKKKAASLPLIIDETGGMTIREFHNKCSRIRRKHKVQLIIADYIELFTGEGDSKEERVSSVSKAGKNISKELDIPVLLLSQLNREVEKRNPPRPTLSDLRYSGAIEADADIVILLYRPEYYNITHNEDGDSMKGIGEWNIAKFRNGKPGKVNTGFVEHTATFIDLEGGQVPVRDFYSKEDDLNDVPF